MNDNVISMENWKQKINEIRVVNSLRKSAMLLIDNGYSLQESKNAMNLAYGEKYLSLINEIFDNFNDNKGA